MSHDDRTAQSDPRSGGSIAPLVAAAAVVVAVLALVVLWPRHHNSVGDLSCPAAFEAAASWVPAQPQTANADAALVPDGVPEKAVVCGYVHDATTGSKTLHGDPNAVVTALRKVPKTASDQLDCEQYATPTDRDNYLLALSYAGKVIWVRMPGDHCRGTSNGVFTGGTNLRADAAQAYTYGIWPTDSSLTDGCDAKPEGSAKAALPGSLSAATVCLRTADGIEHAYRYDSIGSTMITAYNRLAERGGTAGKCAPGDKAADRPFAASLHAPSGAGAVVTGTRTCVLGPGGVALSGSDADAVYGLFLALIDRR